MREQQHNSFLRFLSCSALLQIFPEPVGLVLGPETTMNSLDHDHEKERLPSIVVEPTEVSEVESGELRWPPDNMDMEEDEEDLFLEQCIPPANIADQIAALVFYGLVVVLGVPGNALVVWVTGFCMPPAVTSLWFLNLALADLLCCLSIPLVMVSVAHDYHWHLGPVACTLVKGLFHLVMFCSVLQLVVISVDRWLLVSKPVWCQNNRRPKRAAWACVAVWCVALIGSTPQFAYAKEIQVGQTKRECVAQYSLLDSWLVLSYQFLAGFLFPFLVIVGCHLVVYRIAERGVTHGRTRSRRTLRVILAVVLSFFLCWLPLHIMDFVVLTVRRSSPHSPKVHLTHAWALSLAYFNSCLNPLLYVCLGRGFKDNMNRSLRNLMPFLSEEPAAKMSIATVETKSSSGGKDSTMM